MQDLVDGDRVELRGLIGGWFVWRDDQIEPHPARRRRIRHRAADGDNPALCGGAQRRAVSSAVFRAPSGERLVRDELQALSSDDGVGIP